MSRPSESDRLLAALREPACYPHAAGTVELIETHISWVFLAGEFAYKIKKPVNLGFLDFGTLEKRRFYCEEELRLNRRTAPGLYVDVVPVAESRDGLRVGGTGKAIEYALRMRRFPQEALADAVARRGELRAAQAEAIAAAIAAFHAGIPAAAQDSGYGSPDHVTAPALANFEQLGGLVADPAESARLEELRDWTRNEGARLRETFAARKRGGFVRECHGDLHLGNIAFLEGRPVPFDCIEFDPRLRWIDVMNEIAFLAMDLLEHGLNAAAWRFLNAYLETTGDYAGVRVLRYYLVYRATVRAMVACIRLHQPGAGAAAQGRAHREYGEYLALAGSLAGSARRALIVMHGLSGSGKTTVAQRMSESLGAVRVRSDVERKRLHGLAAGARTQSQPFGGIYAPEATRLTYARLAQAARDVVESRYGVIVDAAFLRRAEREQFRALARELGAPFLIASCRAGEAALRARVARRETAASDASEAGVSVLENQLATQEPLGADELAHAALIDTERDEAALEEAIAGIAGRLETAGATDG
ncbi:MAG TPA: AAA family ATPase [Burkholderiales bacterium]|nr:AAA family ATPase [Burkholderiales bacterium]